MEKMTIRELQCKLYVENLREEYKNRDFMFTSIGEKKMSRVTQKIEKTIKAIEEQETLSDDDLKKSWNDKFKSISDIRKDLSSSKEYYHKEFLTKCIQNCKDKDFALALLFKCWKERFASEKKSASAIIDSYMLCEMPVDLCNVSVSVLKEIYSEYISLNKKLHLHPTYKEEVLHLISSYDGWDGESALEIDTDFFGKSTKVISNENAYMVSKVLRDLTGVESEVYRIEMLQQLHPEKLYDAIVTRLSSCKDQSYDGIEDFFKILVSHANKKCGRIILVDTERKLASEEMYEFRKKIIDESLLEIYVGGDGIFADVYILHAQGVSNNELFSFVSSHLHSVSTSDNFLTLHNKLSHDDVVSINYNFDATSDLLTGQKGKAYSFRDLFSVPKSGVEEKKISGLYRVFQMKDMQQDFLKNVKNYTLLDECEISGSYKMLTEDKLLFFIGDEKIQCCYVEASTDNPVAVGHQFAVLDLNKEFLTPEYVQILCAKGIMEKAFSGEYMERKYFRHTDCNFFSYIGKEILYTPEDKIVDIPTMIQIPSLEQQRKEVSDAQFINASAIERERALEMLLAEKTWLTEEHIRNIKHRIGNELVPVKNDVDAIYKLLQKHPEGITLDTIRGKNEKVSEILSRLLRCISTVSESLHDLTRTVDKGNLKPVDIVATVQDFIMNAVSEQTFHINSKVPGEIIYVNGSTNMINSILRNIVDNAVRHGFVDKSRNDYMVEISIDKDGNGNCVLDVKNNGVPMNNYAREIYFKRGSVAGSTGHSGIGGADVKETANAMGGDVTLPLSEDAWSMCVRISLPIFNSEKI